MVAREAPAAGRNRFAILDVLRERLPRGLVLEVASGTGEHALWFSAALPDVVWQPSDHDPEAVASIAAWRAAEGGANLLAPLLLDAAAPAWPVARADAVVSVNMVHIAPWAATQGLFAGAARVGAGMVLLYGPFRETGVSLAEGNALFDASLRERDAAWGLRLVAEVAGVARGCGYGLTERVEMPANNLVLVFRRL